MLPMIPPRQPNSPKPSRVCTFCGHHAAVAEEHVANRGVIRICENCTTEWLPRLLAVANEAACRARGQFYESAQLDRTLEKFAAEARRVRIMPAPVSWHLQNRRPPVAAQPAALAGDAR